MVQNVTFRIDNDKEWITDVCFRTIKSQKIPFNIEYWVKPEPNITSLIKDYVQGIMNFKTDVLNFNIDQLKFKWEVKSLDTYMKMFGACILLRYLEEFSGWVLEWHRLCKFMPESQAYLMCNLTKYNNYSHCLTPSLSRLYQLKNFNLNEYFNNCQNIKSLGYNPIFRTVLNMSCFDDNRKFPEVIDWTPQIYEKFCELEPIDHKDKISEVIKMLGVKNYHNSSLSNI